MFFHHSHLLAAPDWTKANSELSVPKMVAHLETFAHVTDTVH